MAQMLNLEGQRFAHLVVVRKAGTSKHGYAMWECVCDCGNTIVIPSQFLRSGRTKSCGCLRTKKAPKPEKSGKRGKPGMDLTGQTFGFLTAVYPTDKRFHRSVIWACRCECGNMREIPAMYLRAGSVQSCGCVKNSEIRGKGTPDICYMCGKAVINRRGGVAVCTECLHKHKKERKRNYYARHSISRKAVTKNCIVCGTPFRCSPLRQEVLHTCSEACEVKWRIQNRSTALDAHRPAETPECQT